MHVWIVENSENRATVKKAGKNSMPRHSRNEGATMLNDDGTLHPDEVATGWLDDIDLHHGGFSHSPPLTRPGIYGTG